MAIVWPCTLPVDVYAAAERQVEVPRADCPSCQGPMVFWSGYSRFVRHQGRDHRIWVPRVRCRWCSTTHALLPAFVSRNRLDSTETIGDVLESATSGGGGVRPAAERLGVPHTTARGWVRRFGRSARRLGVAIAALAVDLGAEALTPLADPKRFALAAIAAAWRAVTALPGWLAVSRWRFCSSVCGGTLVATNTNSPYLVVGRRRFMPPVP
jgi:transposase-like protein